MSSTRRREVTFCRKNQPGFSVICLSGAISLLSCLGSWQLCGVGGEHGRFLPSFSLLSFSRTRPDLVRGWGDTGRWHACCCHLSGGERSLVVSIIAWTAGGGGVGGEGMPSPHFGTPALWPTPLHVWHHIWLGHSLAMCPSSRHLKHCQDFCCACSG